MWIEMDILLKYDLDISFESETLYFVDRPLQSYKNIVIYSENSADFLLIPIQSGWMPNASYLCPNGWDIAVAVAGSFYSHFPSELGTYTVVFS